MVILGLVDGTRAGAAVVRDDRLVAAVDEERLGGKPGPFPWAAAERALQLAGVERSEVRTVALCGRYTPPLAVRRHPDLWRLARDPFSPALVAGTAFQKLLRDTGVGAASADRATDWATGLLRDQGYTPSRVQLVDVHKCAASAAYRTQPQDRVRVFVAHPRGDGALGSVHDAAGGQLDRVVSDRGSRGAHAAVARGLAVLGLQSLAELRDLAMEGSPDPELVVALGEVLSHDEAFRSRRRLERRTIEPWASLAAAPPAIGAASLLERLRRTLVTFVQRRSEGLRGRPVLLAGSWFEDPAMGVRVAEELGLRVQLLPWSGACALAVGAATSVAGLPPRAVSPDLGPEAALLEVPGSTPASAAAEADILASGGALARFVGREASGLLALRGRSVVVRADDAAAVDRCREKLELGIAPSPRGAPPVRPVWLTTTRPGVGDQVSGWEHGVTVGGATFVGPDGSADLRALLDETARRGIPALMAFPLARRGRRPACSAEDVLALASEASLDAVRVGDRLLRRTTGLGPRPADPVAGTGAAR